MIERKYLAHFIDANFGTGTANYVRLGKDLEEYNDELNPDIEIKKNILGEQNVHINGYEVSSEVDPFYPDYDETLSDKIFELANKRATGDECKTTVLDVLLAAPAQEGDTPTVKWAYREDVVVVPSSVGGDTSGVQTPFTINRAGNRVRGTFNPDTKVFTEL